MVQSGQDQPYLSKIIPVEIILTRLENAFYFGIFSLLVLKQIEIDVLKAKQDKFVSMTLWTAVLVHKRITNSHLAKRTNQVTNDRGLNKPQGFLISL